LKKRVAGILVFLGGKNNIDAGEGIVGVPHNNITDKYEQWEPTHHFENLSFLDVDSLTNSIEKIECRFLWQKGDSFLPVNNLLGNTIQVTQSQKYTSLIIGSMKVEDVGSITNIPIRLTDEIPNDDIMKETIATILKRVYLQSKSADGPAFDSFWKTIAESSQLDLKVSQACILDDMIPTINILQAKGLAGIQHIICEIENTRSIIAELQVQNGDEKTSKKNQELLLTQKASLANYIVKNNEIQEELLQKVREKIEQFQYEKDSIPFELFQNADDAYVERTYYDADFLSDFSLEIRASEIVFIHNGRPINYRGSTSLWEQYPGFRNDLIKMLSISGSDKLTWFVIHQ